MSDKWVKLTFDMLPHWPFDYSKKCQWVPYVLHQLKMANVDIGYVNDIPYVQSYILDAIHAYAGSQHMTSLMELNQFIIRTFGTKTLKKNK